MAVSLLPSHLLPPRRLLALPANSARYFRYIGLLRQRPFQPAGQRKSTLERCSYAPQSYIPINTPSTGHVADRNVRSHLDHADRGHDGYTASRFSDGGNTFARLGKRGCIIAATGAHACSTQQYVCNGAISQPAWQRDWGSRELCLRGHGGRWRPRW